MPGKFSENWNFGSDGNSSETDMSPEISGADFAFENPEVKSATTIDFKFKEYEGRELRPGHNCLFVIPEEFKGRILRDIILRHRKAEKFRTGEKSHDPHGAYSRVEAHDENTGIWKQWIDPKGYDSDKYAEWRGADDPENEVLHDWLATVGEVAPDIIKVTNVGEHEELSTSQIHSLEVVFYPELKNVSYKERIYTSGTEFIDIEKGKNIPKYGGGSKTEGIYNNAVALNSTQEAPYPLRTDPGPEASLENGRLIINLDSNKKLIQIEVVVGDTEHLREINPKTGRRTRLGWAKLWIGIQKQNGNINWFIENANVPPQGVIAGGPLNPEIHPGDKLIIESRSDTTYLMAWRLAYKSPETLTEAA